MMIHRILSKVVEIDHFKARHSSALGLTVWGAFYAKKRATEVTRQSFENQVGRHSHISY